MATRAQCPVCGNNLRAENLATHLREVHPGKADAAAIRKAERDAARPGLGDERTRRVKKGAPLWVVPFSVILVIFVVLGVLIYLNVQSAPPPPLQPVTEMCVSHTDARHDHASLKINLPAYPAYPIPKDTGTDPCMRPLHTHDATGTIHIEGPAGRAFTLGDFFTIWGQTFTASQIMSCQDDATNDITMTVNGASNTAFRDLVLEDGQSIVITCG